MSSPKIQRALISVSDKSGLAELAAALTESGVEIFSTGGTRRHLEEQGIEVRDVSAYTGFPEMMDGRLKTLHPKVFGGILCRHDREDDMQGIAEQGIAVFELVVVSLYPFEQTIAKPGVTMPEAIEQIDIGGPSLVRAAAKNHKFTAIVTNPSQYASIAEQLRSDGSTTLQTRKQLAADAFAMTARYDTAIADYFAKQLQGGDAKEASGGEDDDYPDQLQLNLQKQSGLRYGENPHQPAAVYRDSQAVGPSLVGAEQLNGKELSYNNLLDLDSALTVVRTLKRPAVSVIKHNNPCGAAAATQLSEACRKAMAGDPVSAFGSVLGVNREVDAAMAEVLCEPGLFVEAIVAPSFAAEAVELLTTKPKWKKNVRLLAVGPLDAPAASRAYRQIEGGMLVQAADQGGGGSDWKVVTEHQPSDAMMADLQFGWEAVRHVKSNAIVLAKDESLVGVGAGQMSRVDSVEIAIRKAGERSQGSVLASDAFFPFPDSIHAAAEAGVVAIVQPGGSKRDDEVIAACNERGLPMIFTGRRHFKH